MIIGIGTDIVMIERIQKLLDTSGDTFLDRCFTENERAFPAVHPQAAAHYAKRYAVKEATAKALGTGIGDGVTFKDIEITSLPHTAPTLSLTGRARDIAIQKAGGMLPTLHVTLSDDHPAAVAFVILETKEQNL